MKRWLRLALPVAGLAAAVALAVQSRGPVRAETRPSAPSAASGRVIAEGRLVPYPGAEVVVSSEVAGTLVALPVEEKQLVKKGQVLAELRADDWRAQLAEARAQLVAAEAEVRLATYESGRAEDLLAKQVDTASRRDRATRDLEVATARRDSAKAAIVRFDAEIAKRRIVAPIDGVVLLRPVDPGETIEARAPILTLADLSRVRIEAEVDEFDTSRVQLGAEVSITAEGFDDARWRGEVEEIPDSVSGRRLKPQDPGKPSDTRVLLVKVKLAEPTPLKLGQRVLVEISPGRT
jgi:RND family efflux transporter MFP subunit